MNLKNLSAAKGNLKGEINIHWDSVENAVSYIIEIGKSNPSKRIRWEVLDIICDPCYTVRELKSNKNYYFRIASMNRGGHGQISQKIIKKAP